MTDHDELTHDRALLSNDLGAVAGLLFDIGSGRYAAPPRDEGSEHAWREELDRVRAEAAQSSPAAAAARDADRSHSEVQA